MRIIQEFVPGKQLTLIHLIANPDSLLYEKLGLEKIEGKSGAIGIVTVTPAETAIILGDIAMKTSGIYPECIDRVSGTLIVTGTVSEVETALKALSDYAENKLKFEVVEMTKT